MLGVTEIKTVPYVPMSHPFVERLIGTIRREYLDVALFWTAVDLESKLSEFRDYYNLHRSHAGLDGKTPEGPPGVNVCATLKSYRWRGHCRGLFHTPIAAQAGIRHGQAKHCVCGEMVEVVCHRARSANLSLISTIRPR